MKVLIACEFSGIVREAFRKRGHDAWSCDLLPTEIPGNHIQDDVLKHLGEGWDLMIAHPPCTFLASSGAKWLYDSRYPNRKQDQCKSMEFVRQLANAPIHRIAIENPVGCISREWRQPDQIIQPYFFGDEAQKSTCLWLKNLPPLQHAAEADWFTKKTHVGKGAMHITKSGRKIPAWYSLLAVNPNRQKLRSKTFPGVAQAMSEQWG